MPLYRLLPPAARVPAPPLKMHGLLVHTSFRSVPQPVPRASSRSSSSGVQRRAPLAEHRNSALAADSLSKHLPPLNFDAPQTWWLPNLMRAVQPNALQDF